MEAEKTGLHCSLIFQIPFLSIFLCHTDLCWTSDDSHNKLMNFANCWHNVIATYEFQTLQIREAGIKKWFPATHNKENSKPLH